MSKPRSPTRVSVHRPLGQLTYDVQAKIWEFGPLLSLSHLHNLSVLSSHFGPPTSLPLSVDIICECHLCNAPSAQATFANRPLIRAKRAVEDGNGSDGAREGRRGNSSFAAAAAAVFRPRRATHLLEEVAWCGAERLRNSPKMGRQSFPVLCIGRPGRMP